MCDILKYNGNKPQSLILLLSPLCQVTSCQMSYLYDYLCRHSALIFAFTSFHQKHVPNRGFRTPETKRPRAGGAGYQLMMAQGIYRLTGSNDETKVAENIMRAGPGSWPNTYLEVNKLSYSIQPEQQRLKHLERLPKSNRHTNIIFQCNRQQFRLWDSTNEYSTVKSIKLPLLTLLYW